jgi:hypothetical protein
MTMSTTAGPRQQLRFFVKTGFQAAMMIDIFTISRVLRVGARKSKMQLDLKTKKRKICTRRTEHAATIPETTNERPPRPVSIGINNNNLYTYPTSDICLFFLFSTSPPFLIYIDLFL